MALAVRIVEEASGRSDSKIIADQWACQLSWSAVGSVKGGEGSSGGVRRRVASAVEEMWGWLHVIAQFFLSHPLPSP